MPQTPNDLHVERYFDGTAFDMLRPYWNALLSTTRVDDPFLTWEWQSTWWNNYGGNDCLWLLVAWENDEPVGILPLMQTCQTKHGIHARCLCMVGKWDIDHCAIIAPENRPDILRAFATYLRKKKREWEILRLNNFLSTGQRLDDFLGVFKPAGHIVTISQELPHIYFSIDAEWEKNVQRLKGKLRRKVGSKLSLLKKDHSLSCVHATGGEITEKHMQDFYEIGLKGHFPYLYQHDEDRSFHQALVTQMRSEVRMSLHLLYIDDVPAAYHYGFLSNNKYFAWRTAFDPTFLEYAPGHIILYETLRDFSRQGVLELDFLRGDARYKREWSEDFRLYRDWQIVRKWSLCALIFVRISEVRQKFAAWVSTRGSARPAPVRA